MEAVDFLSKIEAGTTSTFDVQNGNKIATMP